MFNKLLIATTTVVIYSTAFANDCNRAGDMMRQQARSLTLQQSAGFNNHTINFSKTETIIPPNLSKVFSLTWETITEADSAGVKTPIFSTHTAEYAIRPTATGHCEAALLNLQRSNYLPTENSNSVVKGKPPMIIVKK